MVITPPGTENRKEHGMNRIKGLLAFASLGFLSIALTAATRSPSGLPDAGGAGAPPQAPARPAPKEATAARHAITAASRERLFFPTGVLTW